MEMGLLPGTRIEMVRRAPLGDPLEIRLRGYLLSVNSLEAADVHLAPDGQADPDVYAAGGNGRESAVPTRFATHPPGDGAPHERPSRVLVAGNANSGKSTIFNALTGARAKVGNYPGVTVTRASREVELRDGARVEVVDLPGTYSLSAYSPDEQVAVDEVLGRRGDLPDTVVVVVDSVSLERGLYLVMQIVETGVPVVVALNMLDEALAAGIEVDAARLSDWLGVTVVPMVASAGEGNRRSARCHQPVGPSRGARRSRLARLSAGGPNRRRRGGAVARRRSVRPYAGRAPLVGDLVAAVPLERRGRCRGTAGRRAPDDRRRAAAGD